MNKLELLNGKFEVIIPTNQNELRKRLRQSQPIICTTKEELQNVMAVAYCMPIGTVKAQILEGKK